MKTLKIISAISLSLSVFFACSTEEVIYDGQQACELKLDNSMVFAVPGDDNARNLEVWLLKPAESDVTVPVRIAKSTRPGSLYIDGQTYAVGEEFTVRIPKGALMASAQVTTGKSYYNSAKIDTLSFELPDPNFGRTSPSYFKSTAALYYTIYCPATVDDLQQLKGMYHDMDVDLEFEVTDVIGDTLVIDGLYDALKYMTGVTPIEGYPLKFVVDNTAQPMTVRVAGDQPFFVTTLETGDGKWEDVTIWARGTLPSGAVANGTLNFCEKQMALLIPRYIPGQSSSGAWEIYIKKE